MQDPEYSPQVVLRPSVTGVFVVEHNSRSSVAVVVADVSEKPVTLPTTAELALLLLLLTVLFLVLLRCRSSITHVELMSLLLPLAGNALLLHFISAGQLPKRYPRSAEEDDHQSASERCGKGANCRV